MIHFSTGRRYLSGGVRGDRRRCCAVGIPAGPRRRSSNCLRLALVALFACAVGCSEEVAEQVDERISRAQQHMAQAVETVKRTTNVAGEIELALNPPVQVKACYASLIVVDAGRPAVLQVRSYPGLEAELYPSVLVRAPVEAKAAADLVGTTVSAQVFVQAKKDGPIWHCPAPESIQLRIDEAADGAIKGAFVGGQLVSTETGQAMDITGTFTGSLQ